MTTWKYNAEKHEVVEQPTIEKPGTGWIWNDDLIVEYNQHLASLRSILVLSKVDWKNGDDVTGKFTIGRGKQIESIEYQIWEELAECDKDKYFEEVAIPIIKQEQPQPRNSELRDFANKVKAELKRQEGEEKQSQEQDNVKWKRYRFKTYAEDNRPLVFNPKYAWWCSGYGGFGGRIGNSDEFADDDMYSIIIAYLPNDEDLKKYWDDAFDIEFTEETGIKFSSRFPKPEYFIEDKQESEIELWEEVLSKVQFNMFSISTNGMAKALSNFFTIKRK